MRKALVLVAAGATMLALALVLGYGGPSSARAASHREAPLIAMDPEADITDFFLFRSYEAGKADKVALIMNVIPGEEPSSGPNYYFFDPSVTYSFNVDNNLDGVAEDVRFEFKFRTEFRGVPAALKLPLSYVGGVTGVPPITSLDGPGSEGLGLRQHYSVTMIRGTARTVLADGLIAVPSNVGPRTMPSYDSLAAQGIYTLPGGNVRVFAGQREDPFYIDLGGVFDSLNLRRFPPIESAAEDANDSINPFGVDMLSGFNVNTIALEVPVSLLTKDGLGAGHTGTPKIGAYAETDRPRVTVRGGHGDTTSEGAVQVQRLANPLVNEAIIGTVDKDRWNSLEPEQEAQFEDYYLNPRLAVALELATGVPAAKSGRTDLRDLLLKYGPSDTQLSELLRLNVNVAPTPLAAQRRLGPLATPADPAAWPNGRRPKDDVTDIAVRVVGGPNYIAARAADGVNTNDRASPATFPFLGTPWDGRNRVHQNP